MTKQWTVGNLTVAVNAIPGGVLFSWRMGSEPWDRNVFRHTSADTIGQLLATVGAEIGIALRRAAGATDEEIER